MAERRLSQFPIETPVKSELDIMDIRCRLAGLIKSGGIRDMREGGLIEVIHLLVEEIAELKYELEKLRI